MIARTYARHGPVGNPGLESVRDRGLGSAADHSPAVPEGQGAGALLGRDGHTSARRYLDVVDAT